jgi:putative hydrolase of the HAD superfamily
VSRSQSSEPQVRAYLVDLDGTLYRPGWVKLGMALELLCLGPHRLSWLRAFRHEHERMRGTSEQEFNPSPYEVQVARAAEHLAVAPAELQKVVEEWMQRRPGKWLRLAKNAALLQEIATFKQAGGKTALVSDYPASAKLDALGIRSHFDIIVANGETLGLSRLKPAPDGYLLAASALGVPPAECLVIGDREDADGAAARAAGMQFRLV